MSSETKQLKVVKKMVRMKVSDVCQCRTCLRIVGRDDVRETRSSNDIRRKIHEAVGVKITKYDKTTAICINCLRLVDIIYNYKRACLKVNALHSTKLLSLHPGTWTSEENLETLENCQELVQRHRMEIDKLYDCSGLDKGPGSLTHDSEDHALPPSEAVVLDPVCEIIDSDPELSEEYAKAVDTPVDQNKSRREPTKVKCSFCAEMIPKFNMEYHLNKHQNMKPYICPYEKCKLSYYSRHAVDRHVKIIHTNPRQKYPCEVCGILIKGVAYVASHMELHKEGGGSRKVSCSVCSKRFYKSHLQDHMAIHTGELKYSCTICARKFRAKTNLITHMKTHK